MANVSNIAVKCSTVEQKAEVIDYAKGGKNGYDAKLAAECINLESGSHGSEGWYTGNGYTIIPYEEFEKTYLKKAMKYEFIVGKWYEFKPNWSTDKQYGKYKNISSDNTYFEPWICNANSYSPCGSFQSSALNYVKEIDPSIIQKFLPEGHADKKKQNPNTDFIFTPGKIYVCSFDNRSVLFKTKTGVLAEECWIITTDGNYINQMGCCTSDGNTYRDATEEETNWLEACIKAGKTVPKEKVMKATKKNVKDLVYLDVIHIETKEQWEKIIEFHTINFYDSEYKYYLIGAGGGYARTKAVYTCQPDIKYNVLEFSDVIFPEEKKLKMLMKFKVGDVIKFKTNNERIPAFEGGESGCGVYNIPGHIRKALPEEIPQEGAIVGLKDMSGDWCVKLKKENKEDLLHYLNTEHDACYSGDSEYYGIESGKHHCSGFNWGRLLSTERFYEEILGRGAPGVAKIKKLPAVTGKSVAKGELLIIQKEAKIDTSVKKIRSLDGSLVEREKVVLF